VSGLAEPVVGLRVEDAALKHAQAIVVRRTG
jgi:hypothetical protein